MSFTLRRDLGRPLSFDEMDNNFLEVESMVSSANQSIATTTAAAESAAISAGSAGSDAASAKAFAEQAEEYAASAIDAAGDAAQLAQAADAKADIPLTADDPAKGPGAIPYDELLNYPDGSLGKIVKGNAESVSVLTEDISHISERLDLEAWVTDYGATMSSSTVYGAANAAALLEAIRTGRQVVIPGNAFRANIGNASDANEVLDAIHRIHIRSGTLNPSSGAELADVAIYLPGEKIARSKRVVFRGSQITQLQLRGAPRTALAFVSASRTFTAPGEVLWNVTFADASGVSVGDYIRASDLAGAGTNAYRGTWPVTAVSGNVVTMLVPVWSTSFSTTFTSGVFERCSTVVEFDGSLGFQVGGDWMGSSNTDAGIIDITIVGINQSSSMHGLYMERGARISGLRIDIHGFGTHNLYQLPGSVSEITAIHSCGAINGHGSYQLSGAIFGCGTTLSSQSAVFNGNKLYGIAPSVGSVVTATGSVVAGNGACGVVGDQGSNVVMNNSLISHNGSQGSSPFGGGVLSMRGSTIQLDGSTVVANASYNLRARNGGALTVKSGSYNGAIGSVDVLIDDSRSYYVSDGGSPVLGVVSNPFISTIKRANIAHNFGTVPANSEVSGPSVSISGVTSAMNVFANSNVSTSGINLVARVTATDTVTIYAQNVTASPIGMSNRTFYVAAIMD